MALGSPVRIFLVVGIFFFAAARTYAYQNVLGCLPLENAYGPFDYTNPMHFKDKLPIVEKFHFTLEVESLLKGKSGSIDSDLGYTLRAFPNHHRALYAMMRYQAKHPVDISSPSHIECYFKRALAFKRDDGVVWMLYGIYKHKQKKYKEALDKYKTAEKLLKESSELSYNMGLLYLDMGKTDLARKYARMAYDRGYPLPALREKLNAHDSRKENKAKKTH